MTAYFDNLPLGDDTPLKAHHRAVDYIKIACYDQRKRINTIHIPVCFKYLFPNNEVVIVQRGKKMIIREPMLCENKSRRKIALPARIVNYIPIDESVCFIGSHIPRIIDGQLVIDLEPQEEE